MPHSSCNRFLTSSQLRHKVTKVILISTKTQNTKKLELTWFTSTGEVTSDVGPHCKREDKRVACVWKRWRWRNNEDCVCKRWRWKKMGVYLWKIKHCVKGKYGFFNPKTISWYKRCNTIFQLEFHIGSWFNQCNREPHHWLYISSKINQCNISLLLQNFHCF